jgi:hypothetical protein
MQENIKNISAYIREQLPFYISSDEEYGKFVKFLELYYEWMAEESNVSQVTNKIVDYTDLDQTLDLFVSMFKSELADSFPNITRIKGLQFSDENVEADTQSLTETTSDQHFFADGNNHTFKLNYFSPIYYLGNPNDDSSVVDIRVFSNAAGSARGTGTTLDAIVEHLTDPELQSGGALGSYVELVENVDYILDNNQIKFIDSNGDPQKPTSNDLIKVRFYIQSLLATTATADTEDAVKKIVSDASVKKTSYTNQKNFLKFMKEFYQSKGTEPSFKFLFRAIFNEDIDIYYPKTNIFKLSNNVWDSNKSLRAIPYTRSAPTDPKIETPYKVVGKTSKAEGIVEYYKDFKLGNNLVREYFITNIIGEFSSKEKIEIFQTNNTSYEEELYECVVGFEITSPGTDYPRNRGLTPYISSAGSGTGFSALIEHTTPGHIEEIEIVGAGEGYITGEQIEFADTGTLGSGGLGEVADISSTTTNYEVIFNQNPESLEYPMTVFDISLSGDIYPANSTNTVVSIENIDTKYDDVFILYDYEAFLGTDQILFRNDNQYQGYFLDKKANALSYRHKSSLMPVEFPLGNIVNINQGDPTETRVRQDLDLTVTSVDAAGAITGVSVVNATANTTSIFPATVDLLRQDAVLNNGLGFGANFDVVITNNIISNISLSSTDNSQLYSVNDVVKILGSNFAPQGEDITHDVFVKITAVTGGVVVADIDDTQYTTTSENGTGAVWDVDTTQATYPKLISLLLSDADSNNNPSPTTGYVVGDTFTIPGTLIGGSTPEHDLVIQVTEVDDSGRINDFAAIGRPQGGQISAFQLMDPAKAMPDSVNSYFSPTYSVDVSGGSDLRFSVNKIGNSYETVDPFGKDRGSNYVVGSIITVLGSELGGADGTNDLTIRIDETVDGNVDGSFVSGQVRKLSVLNGTAANSDSYLNLNVMNGKGRGAKFDVSINSGNFSATVSPSFAGSGYEVGQTLTISGQRLGYQWIKDNFVAGLSKVGDNALFTNFGYTRTNDIDAVLDEKLTSGELTLDFWYFRKSISVTDLSSPGGTLFSFNVENTGEQKSILWQRPDGTLLLEDGGGNQLTSAQLEFGKWHHIAIHFSNASTTLYVDGKKEDTISSVNMLQYSSGTNFYVGARQEVSADYIMFDYTLGFFGSMRFTSGQRYEEQPINVDGDILVEDRGTENPISGNGLNPIHVNPVPSYRTIRNSTQQQNTFTADQGQTIFALEYDASLQVNILVNDVSNTNFTATDGEQIIFNSGLSEGDIVKVSSYSNIEDDVEYIIYDNTNAAAGNKISLRHADATGIYSTYNLPDGHSLRVKYSARPPAGVSGTRLISKGANYIRQPYGYVRNKTLSYSSQGDGAFFKGMGSSIGGISKVKIFESDIQDEYDGFGVGYDTAPTIDLSSIGNGDAQVTVKTGPLCVREGAYINDQGFLSDNNRITDSYLWQDYSYVIKVGRYIDEWRKIVKKVLHPAGMMMFGEYSITTTAGLRRTTNSAWSQLIYEIIKNINLKVKNMDGLGRWTYGHSDVQDTNNLNSHGIRVTYDNRQPTIDSMIDGLYAGVGTGEISDDTIGAASVDTGSGRYALLDSSNADALDWNLVEKIALNYKDAFGTDNANYYESEIIGNNFTVYDTSDASITSDEWLNTRPWGKYEVTSVEFDDDAEDRYAILSVKYLRHYKTMPNLSPENRVEFRWDNIFRGNVDRQPNHWIGSTADGANPRDEKMIINISGRYNNNKEGDVPTLHTTYRSLERFKFYFTASFPWQNLSPYLFSPQAEMYTSPWLNRRKLIQGNTLTHVARRPTQYNMWYFLPVEVDGDDEWIANTDGTDHKWTNTRIAEITEKSDRKYRAVLDAHVDLNPVYLVMSEEEPNSSTRKRMGPTNLSVERAKFNEKVQMLDYNVDRIDFDENELYLNTFGKYAVPGGLHDKSNFASESNIVTYNSSPSSIEELNIIISSTLVD